MGTYDLLIRVITPKLSDPLSKAEEPGQPFRLASPIIPIATQPLGREGKPDAYLIIGDFGPNVAVMSFDQFLDNGKADTCTPMFARPRLFTPVKAFEKKGEVLFIEFPPGVGKYDF